MKTALVAANLDHARATTGRICRQKYRTGSIDPTTYSAEYPKDPNIIIREAKNRLQKGMRELAPDAQINDPSNSDWKV